MFHQRKRIVRQLTTDRSREIEEIIDEYLSRRDQEKNFVAKIDKRLSKVHIMSYEAAYGGLMFKE